MTEQAQKHAGGRPTLYHGMKLRRVTVMLPEEYIDWAYTDGNGNISAGLRRLLEELDQRLGAEAPSRDYGVMVPLPPE